MRYSFFDATSPGSRGGRGSRLRLPIGISLLVLIVLLAAQLRLQATFKTTVDTPIRADAADYFAYAYNLRHFGIYSRSKPDGQSVPQPDAVRNPGYPLFLTVLMDDPPSAGILLKITLVQALIGVAVTILAFVLARAFLPLLPALAAALFTAISPHLVNAGVYILSETLFTLCVIVLLCLLVRPGLENRPWVLLISGLVLGICTLVRPTTLYFPFILAALFFLHWSKKTALRASLLIFLGVGLVYGPWMARNLMQFGYLSDPTLQIGTLHHGLYPDFMYQNDPASFGFPYRYDPRAQEIARSMESVTGEILARFSAEPGRYLRWYLLGKPYYLWSWDDVQGMGGSFVYPVTRSPYFESQFFAATYVFLRLLYWPLVILAAGFCIFVWLPSIRRILDPQPAFAAQLCAALLLYVTAIHMIGAPISRYSVPIQPELYIAALGTLYLLLRYGHARKLRHSLLPETAS